jgi:uncharacterized protein YeaO (DUF488 family)
VILGIKSIYEKAGFADGKRILVERLWPRGVRRSTANIDTWVKEVAPSNGLRLRLIAHPEWWPHFKVRYLQELDKGTAVNSLINRVMADDVTLVYSSRNDKHNTATILFSYINKRIERIEKQKAAVLKKKLMEQQRKEIQKMKVLSKRRA